MKKYSPISLKKIKRYSLQDRKSIVDITKMSKPAPEDPGVLRFIDSLPDILAARELKNVVQAIVNARSNDRPVILGMGGHPIKVGLSPFIVDLMQKNIITAIATNGSAIIHDFEFAYMGQTSEDVASEIKTGSFGMAKETGVYLNKAIVEGAAADMGMGSAIGKLISSEKLFPYNGMSIFAEAYRLSIPATVHVAVGTDIIHMHPEADGAAIGKTSLSDFRLLTSIVSDLQEGVFINLGSAVIIPEVFLKALTLARNLGNQVNTITTVNMDFLKQYRPLENVVKRPTSSGGKGYNLVGHHEIMFPLLAAGVKEMLASANF